ncbi:hypothetical protein LR48_Vigan03g210100 [Vigna angularis]|uniref:Uncharacterized protein n=1 Tax=Phaseolus angularis TaxID=3914 RepID=A0A0L9U8D2_PHAAN|nr:hypothetical protein LR48_Vigan03g210100 [Vigna angularis]
MRVREREKKISYSVADKGKESSVAVTRDHRIERTGGKRENLGKQCKLFDAEVSGGGEGVKGEIDCGSAMRVPAASFAAIGAGLVLGRDDGDLATVEELEHEKEDLVADGVDWDDAGARVESRAGGVEGGGRVRAAEEFAEEEATGGEYAAVGVDEATLDAESDVAEGLAVDEEVEVIEGERS